MTAAGEIDTILPKIAGRDSSAALPTRRQTRGVSAGVSVVPWIFLSSGADIPAIPVKKLPVGSSAQICVHFLRSMDVLPEASEFVSEPRKKPFLERRDPWGHGVSLWLVVVVGFLVPVLAWALRDLRLENDVAGWLPKNDPQAKILSWYQGMFPSEDRVLVSWDDCSITDPRLKAVQEILEGTETKDGKREGGSPYVEDVTLPTELLSKMLDQDVSFEQAMEQIDGVLIGKGPLKLQFTDTGRRRGEYLVKEILKLANETYHFEAQVVNGNLPSPVNDAKLEDTKAFAVYSALKKYTDAEPLIDLQLSWKGMHRDTDRLEEFRAALLEIVDEGSGSQSTGEKCVESAFVTPGSLAALSVTLSEAGVADRKTAVASIREAVASANVTSEMVRMGGQPVVSVALNQAVVDAAWNREKEKWNLPQRSPILLSVILTIVLSFVMLRSLRLATLVQIVGFLTVIIALAMVPLTGGTLSMVLIVMPTLLMVLTTSAAIHLSNYWKHSEESDPTRSVFKAAQTAWLPCALAAGTTAIGLASLMASNLVPVRDFGMYAAVGCILSFLIVLYLLPSLMLYWPKSPPQLVHQETAVWNRIGVFLARHRIAVCSLCLIGTAAAGMGLQYFRTETKVIRYFPTASRLVQDYEFLEDQLAGVISIDTIVKFDTKAQQDLSFVERARHVMELQREIRQHPEISGVLSLASFLDLREADPETMSRFQRERHKRAQKAFGRKIYDRLEEGDKSVASMLALPDYSTDWQTPGDGQLNMKGDEVWRITAQTSALSDVDLEVLIGDMNKIASKHLSLVGSPNTGHVVTGLIPVFLRTQQAVLESLIRSFGMAFVLIAVVMMFVLRNPIAGAMTMLPNLMPVVLIFGAISWMDLRVDIGTMITASVALGIAVDGTLHLLTWFKDLVSKGVPVEQAVGRALEHCGPAMWQTSLAIGLGMVALLFADLLLVSRFGLIMFLLIFAALAADVIFLPALLGGALGKLIRNAVYVEPSDDPADSPATVPMAESAALTPDRAESSGQDAAAEPATEAPLKDVS